MYAEVSVFLGGKEGRFWKHAPNLFSPKKDRRVIPFYFVNNFKITKASHVDFFSRSTAKFSEMVLQRIHSI